MDNQFGKQLSKSVLEIDLQMGELAGGYAALLAFSTANGERRLFVAKEEATRICTQLNTLLGELQKSTKECDKEESRIRKEYQAACQMVIKTKEKDVELKKQYEGLQIQLLQSKDMKPKNLQVLQKKVFEADKSSKKGEADYKAAVEKQNKTRDTYYQLLGGIMGILEKFDRTRVETMKKLMLEYAKLQEGFAASLSEQLEKFGRAIENVNVDRDMQSFISKTKSGNKRPPFEAFEPVDNKIIKQLTLSKFPVDFGARRNTMKKSANLIIPPSGSAIGNVVTGAKTPTVSNSGESSPKLGLSSSSSRKSIGASSAGPLLGLTGSGNGNVSTKNLIGGGNGSTSELKPKQSETSLSSKSQTTDSSKQSSDLGNAGKQQGSETVLKKVSVLYDYDANGPEEVSLKAGDVIQVLDLGEGDGWWSGEVLSTKKRGLFPSNFVTDLVNDTVKQSSSSSSNNGGPGADGALSGKSKNAIALFAYEPQDPMEIPLLEGNVIEVQSFGEDGWWHGKIISGPGNIGRVGLFPSNYVSTVNTEEEDAS